MANKTAIELEWRIIVYDLREHQRVWVRVLRKSILRLTHLIRASVYLLMLAACSPAYSSIAASVGCAELLREVEPLELANFTTPKGDRRVAERLNPKSEWGR